MPSDSRFRATNGEFHAFDRVWNCYTTPQLLEDARSFQFKATDVVVATFPRTGTILTQELVWRALHGTTVPQEAALDINVRFPFLEFNPGFNQGLKTAQELLAAWPKERGPRLIKTHLPPELLEPSLSEARPKLLINLRNPKDTALSLFNFYRGLVKYRWDGTWDEFFEIFMAGRCISGSFFDNVRAWWAMRHLPHVLLLRYEDLVTQPHQELRRIARHLGIPEMSAAEEAAVVRDTRIERMRNDPSVTRNNENTKFNFIQRGKVGTWREVFSPEQSERMDAEIRKHFGEEGPHFAFG